MYQCQIPIGRMPINLVLLSNGTLAFVRVATFTAIIDQASTEEDVSATFDMDGLAFHYKGEVTEFDYNVAYEYKTIPTMLKWLQAQNLQEPD